MKRNKEEIKKWMKENRWGVVAIGRKAGVKAPTVCATLNGARNDRKTLRTLVAIGCPVEYLGLPEDLKEAV